MVLGRTYFRFCRWTSILVVVAFVLLLLYRLSEIGYIHRIIGGIVIAAVKPAPSQMCAHRSEKLEVYSFLPFVLSFLYLI